MPWADGDVSMTLDQNRLGPYVGLTLETTTSIIGAVLAVIALGATPADRLR